MSRNALQDASNTVGTIVLSSDNGCQDENKSKCSSNLAVPYLEPRLHRGENYRDVYANHNMAMHTYLQLNEQPITLPARDATNCKHTGFPTADVSSGGAAWPRNMGVNEPRVSIAFDTKVDIIGLLQNRKDYFRTTCVSKKSFAQRLGRSSSLILCTIENFLHDPQHSYTIDFLAHMFLEEAKNMSNPDYMQMQPHINRHMRTILVSWLLEVHVAWKLRKETWFLAVSLLDQYLSNHVVKREQLQLVGSTALCIASKYEEINPRPLRDWTVISDHSFTVNDIVQMEFVMISSLGGDFVKPTTNDFLEVFLDLFVNADIVQSKFARHIITLASLDLGMIKYPPSCIAAAAISLSKKMIWHVPFKSSTRKLMLQCLQELRAVVMVDNESTI